MGYKKLSDLVNFNPKRSLKKGEMSKFVDMASIPANSRDVSEIQLKVYNGGGSKFKNGDTLFSRITPCLENGKTAKVSGLNDDEVAHGSTEFIVMSAKAPELDSDYIYYLARSPEFRAYAQSRMEGTSGRQRVSWQALAEYEFYYPEKTVRQKTGEMLKSLDDKIQHNTQTNQTLENIAQAIFKSWFVDFDPVKTKIAVLENGGTQEEAELAAMQKISAKSREELTQFAQQNPPEYQQLAETAALFPSKMQDSELGEIPEGWEVKSLTELVTLTGGGTPKRSEPEYWNGDILWFSVKDLPKQNGIFVVDTEEKITNLGLQKSSTKLLAKGTTIITARGTVGKLALTGTEMCMNQSCYGVTGKYFGPYFNYFYLAQAVVTLKQNTHGAVFDTITTSTFDVYRSSFCGEKLAAQFEKIISSLMELSLLNIKNNIVLNNTKNNLLTKLFRVK